MTDELALRDQALAAADEFVAENFASPAFDAERTLLRYALAMMWLEGRQAGGMEAAAVMRDYIKGL